MTRIAHTLGGKFKLFYEVNQKCFCFSPYRAIQKGNQVAGKYCARYRCISCHANPLLHWGHWGFFFFFFLLQCPLTWPWYHLISEHSLAHIAGIEIEAVSMTSKYPQDGDSICCCYDYRVDAWLQNCVMHWKKCTLMYLSLKCFVASCENY